MPIRAWRRAASDRFPRFQSDRDLPGTALEHSATHPGATKASTCQSGTIRLPVAAGVDFGAPEFQQRVAGATCNPKPSDSTRCRPPPSDGQAARREIPLRRAQVLMMEATPVAFYKHAPETNRCDSDSVSRGLLLIQPETAVNGPDGSGERRTRRFTELRHKANRQRGSGLRSEGLFRRAAVLTESSRRNAPERNAC